MLRTFWFLWWKIKEVQKWGAAKTKYAVKGVLKLLSCDFQMVDCSAVQHDGLAPTRSSVDSASFKVHILQRNNTIDKWPVLLWFYLKTLGLYHSGTNKMSKDVKCNASGLLLKGDIHQQGGFPQFFLICSLFNTSITTFPHRQNVHFVVLAFPKTGSCSVWYFFFVPLFRNFHRRPSPIWRCDKYFKFFSF